MRGSPLKGKSVTDKPLSLHIIPASARTSRFSDSVDLGCLTGLRAMTAQEATIMAVSEADSSTWASISSANAP